MKNRTELMNAWSTEYSKQGIPSSFRKDPTKVIPEFLLWLKKKNHSGNVAADLGCGLGRNSFYLASKGYSVISLDLLEENAGAINKEAKLLNLPIEAFAQDLSATWSIVSESLDIAIDIFCYKHIDNKKAQQKYRNELWKSLRPDGYYLISLASVNDGFYGPLLETSPLPKEKLIIDPYAQIPSYLYSLNDLSEEFSDLFTVIESSEDTSKSPMHGKEYTRKVLNFIFKKKLP